MKQLGGYRRLMAMHGRTRQIALSIGRIIVLLTVALTLILGLLPATIAAQAAT
jgi:hypothetical protein